MKTDSLVLTKSGKIEMTRVKVPDLGPDDVLIEVKSAGICRMDISLFTGKLNLGYPCYHGHEATGVVVEVGQNVKSFKAGDAVTAIAYPTYQRYLVAPAGKTVKIPVKKPEWAQWMIEPAACAVHGVQASNFKLGGTVAMIGCGYMGQLMLQAMSRETLGRLVVMDANENMLKLAKELGVEEVYTPKQSKELKALAQQIGGFDVVIEASGAKGTIDLAAELLHNGGMLNIFGWHMPKETIATTTWHMKGLIVINPSPMMAPDFMPYMRAAVTMMATGRIDQHPLITHIYPFEKAQQAFEAAANRTDGYIKGVLEL